MSVTYTYQEPEKIRDICSVYFYIADIKEILEKLGMKRSASLTKRLHYVIKKESDERLYR